LPEKFVLRDWASVKPFYDTLLHARFGTVQGVRDWLRKRSELEACIMEEGGWRYIRMTCDTSDAQHLKAYEEFITHLEPEVQRASDALNKHINAVPLLEEIDRPGYDILRRNLQKEIRIFREENVPLFTGLKDLSKQYNAISGAMTVEIDGEELTLQQAGALLESTDRARRADAYSKISHRRLQDRESLDVLFDKMVSLRHHVAANAGFDNYRDYMFTAMGRFDYTPSDCFAFHESVRTAVVPLAEELARHRRDALGLDHLKPWDKAVDPTGKPPLRPFRDSAHLLESTITCFDRVHPLMGETLRLMQSRGHLDLDSRKGKAPGGYNYPLPESGLPFIFMNATSTLRDMVTLLHEGGHAVHAVLTRDLELLDFQNPPSEIAELASMTMELLTMDHWDIFFASEDDLRRARRQHLEQVLETLPWVACIDSFQHWIYENPTHSADERAAAWTRIFGDFSDSITDWDGYAAYRANLWQKQLHLYEVPFYYIEYGFAQLGAIAIWKNFREHPNDAIAAYLDALRLGYTRPISEVYKAAGIEFDFGKDYIAGLMRFVRDQLEML
jgi:oligoendopeptidase F